MTKEQKFIFDPHNIFANIHGNVNPDGSPTCRINDNTMCTGCCMGLRITEKNNETKLLKEEGENCPSQIIGSGCQHVIEDNPKKRFWVCPIYHCYKDLLKLRSDQLPEDEIRAVRQRLALENISCLHNGEIGLRSYNNNQNRIININKL